MNKPECNMKKRSYSAEYKRIKKTISIIIILVFLIIPTLIFAQKPESVAASNGIYTQFGTQFANDFYYKLERTEKNKTNWQLVCNALFPVNVTTFKNNIVKANMKNSMFSLPNDSILNLIYNKAVKLKAIDSLWGYNANIQIIEALGLGFLDVLAKPDIRYQYRINKIDSIGNVIVEFKTNPKSFPAQQANITSTFIESYTDEQKLHLKFSLSGKSVPYDIAVYRQVYLQNKFHLTETTKSYFKSNDSIFVIVEDRQVTPNQVYQYYIIPYDVVGNKSFQSDTIRIQNILSLTDLPHVLKLEANANTEKNGIELSWKISETKKISTISIFRSTQFDAKFNFLTRTLPSNNNFIDKNIQPGLSYYYYIVVQGETMETPPSAKVSALYKGTRNALMPPQNISMRSDSLGNHISWDKTDFDTRGYYVYRGLGYNPQMKQLSDFIPVQDDTLTFSDSTNNIAPGMVYSYAIAAENTSYSISPLSELIFSKPLKPYLPSPTNFYINRQGDGAFLIWDNLKERTPYITGYNVYRSIVNYKDKENEMKLVNLIPLASTQNSYLDTTIIRGVNYSYKVKATGVEGAESTLSVSFEFELPEILPIPPAGIRLTNTKDGGILYWDSPGTDNIKSYIVYQSTSKNDKPLKLASLDSDKNQFSIKHKTEGTYYFSISTVNNQNIESKRSEEVWYFKE